MRFATAASALLLVAASGFPIAGRAPLAAAGAQAPAPTAEELARSLQQHYSAIRDFRATFEQTAGGGLLKLNAKTQTKGEGTVLVKKPGRMRWEYTKPDKQLIVSDGTRIYSCFLGTKQKECEESPVPREDEAPTATLFLAGKGDILRDFKVARVQSPVRDTLALRLDPRKPDPDYEYLVVAFDAKTYQIRGLMTRDRGAGESTIVFNNIKTNTNMSDNEFTFTPPAGTKTGNKPR